MWRDHQELPPFPREDVALVLHPSLRELRLHLALEPGARLDEVMPPPDEVPDLPGLLVRHVGLGYHVRPQQVHQRPRVDLVRLHLCVGDGLHHQRMRDLHVVSLLLQHVADVLMVVPGLHDDARICAVEEFQYLFFVLRHLRLPHHLSSVVLEDALYRFLVQV